MRPHGCEKKKMCLVNEATRMWKKKMCLVNEATWMWKKRCAQWMRPYGCEKKRDFSKVSWSAGTQVLTFFLILYIGCHHYVYGIFKTGYSIHFDQQKLVYHHPINIGTYVFLNFVWLCQKTLDKNKTCCKECVYGFNVTKHFNKRTVNC